MSSGPDRAPQALAHPDEDLQAAMLQAMFGEDAEPYTDLITPPDADLQRDMLQAMFGEDVEQYAELIHDPAQEGVDTPNVQAASQEMSHEETHTPRRKVVRGAGRIIASATILVAGVVVGLVGVTAGQDAMHRNQPAEQTATSDPATTTTEQADQLLLGGTVIGSSASSSVPETTTTAPPPPFETSPGHVVGSFEIPKTCIDIQVLEVDSSEMALIGETRKKGLVNGEVKADYLTPDPTPVENCPTVDAYAAAHPGFVQRLEATKASAIATENPSGRTSYWQPIAVHENREGKPASAYPGQAGLSVLWAHRTTYSAANRDIEVLEQGDTAYSHRADGKQTEYQFVERLVLSPDNIQTYLDNYYKQKVNESVASGKTANVQMVALGGCADDSGNAGGDSKRVVAIFIAK